MNLLTSSPSNDFEFASSDKVNSRARHYERKTLAEVLAEREKRASRANC